MIIGKCFKIKNTLYSKWLIKILKKNRDTTFNYERVSLLFLISLCYELAKRN